ncbi:hypothetical protein Dimus_009971, partial [Dionaea muscipula]
FFLCLLSVPALFFFFSFSKISFFHLPSFFLFSQSALSTAFDKGKLLRGAESIICVYCGREQQRDYLPGSISFNSTVAFRWLLQSLGLDGSEIVAPTVDDNRTSRGRSVQNEEVSLTNFLNLELEWPGDSERFGDLFPGITAISGASTEQALPKETRKPVENAILQVPGKATLFENQLSSEASMKLDVLVLGQADSFSGWEADFQSASSDTTCR